MRNIEIMDSPKREACGLYLLARVLDHSSGLAVLVYGITPALYPGQAGHGLVPESRPQRNRMSGWCFDGVAFRHRSLAGAVFAALARRLAQDGARRTGSHPALSPNPCNAPDSWL